MTRRFDARLLPQLLDWFFAKAGLEGTFTLFGNGGVPLSRVVAQKTASGLSLHFRDSAEPSSGCGHMAAPGDVFCPACGAAV
jgi:hypothetical protein